MNAQRVVSDLRELAARTATADGAQRLAWGPVWRDARAWFAGKIAELGLNIQTDSAGNNWVTLPGASPKTVIVGSHLDSVPNGGWLDGALGVVAGLEALRMHAGHDAAGDADAGGLGRRGRRALRPQPARIGGGGGQPEDRGRARAQGSPGHAARRRARRERRGARPHARRAAASGSGSTRGPISSSTSSRDRCSSRCRRRPASCSARSASSAT